MFNPAGIRSSKQGSMEFSVTGITELTNKKSTPPTDSRGTIPSPEVTSFTPPDFRKPDKSAQQHRPCTLSLEKKKKPRARVKTPHSHRTRRRASRSPVLSLSLSLPRVPSPRTRPRPPPLSVPISLAPASPPPPRPRRRQAGRHPHPRGALSSSLGVPGGGGGEPEPEPDAGAAERGAPVFARTLRVAGTNSPPPLADSPELLYATPERERDTLSSSVHRLIYIPSGVSARVILPLPEYTRILQSGTLRIHVRIGSAGTRAITQA